MRKNSFYKKFLIAIPVVSILAGFSLAADSMTAYRGGGGERGFQHPPQHQQYHPQEHQQFQQHPQQFQNSQQFQQHPQQFPDSRYTAPKGDQWQKEEQWQKDAPGHRVYPYPVEQPVVPVYVPTDGDDTNQQQQQQPQQQQNQGTQNDPFFFQ